MAVCRAGARQRFAKQRRPMIDGDVHKKPVGRIDDFRTLRARPVGCESTATCSGVPRSSAEQLTHMGRRSVPGEENARKTGKRRLDLAARDTSRMVRVSVLRRLSARADAPRDTSTARSPSDSQQAPRCASASRAHRRAAERRGEPKRSNLNAAPTPPPQQKKCGSSPRQIHRQTAPNPSSSGCRAAGPTSAGKTSPS